MTKKNIDSPRERSASTLSPVEMSEMTDAFPTKSAPLRKLFPGYRERAAVEQEIKSNPLLRAEFLKWKEEKQQEFLDICCGNRGARILYDACFKYVFNPDQGKEHLSRLISVMLGQEVKDVRVLPNESHLGGDYALIIMDIIVETADGTVVNVEVQKVGYNFPGERASCYNADLLLRQYRRVREEVRTEAANTGEDPDRKFSYLMIRPVYTIIFMEKSTSEFKKFMKDYIHTFVPTSDTGLRLNMLQNILYIPLDVFKKNLAEKIEKGAALTEKEAWLAFLSYDEPAVINLVLEQYSEIFQPLYEKICDMCRNTAEVMNMYSRELAILDKNTVMMMIEEQQETIEQQQGTINQQQKTLDQQQGTIDQQQKALDQQQGVINQQHDTIEEQRKKIEDLQRMVDKLQHISGVQTT